MKNLEEICMHDDRNASFGLSLSTKIQTLSLARIPLVSTHQNAITWTRDISALFTLALSD